MSEPTNRELLERIRKLDVVVSSIVEEIAEQREGIEEIRRVISLMNERFQSIERPLHDHCAALVEHTERLYSLEARIFPTLWPTIKHVESVLGDLSDRFDLNNPLDRRAGDRP
jgi:hypothetical protein